MTSQGREIGRGASGFLEVAVHMIGAQSVNAAPASLG